MDFPKTNPWWWNAIVFGVLLVLMYVGAAHFNTSVAFRSSATLFVIALFAITPFLGYKNWVVRMEKIVIGKAPWQKLVLRGLGVGLLLTFFRILANYVFGHTNILRNEFEVEAILWLVILFLSGFAEELYFRGYLMKAPSKGGDFSIAVQGVWFTVYHIVASPHLRLFDFPYYFICGFAFGFLATRDKCLLSAMVAHVVFNLAQFALG